MKAILKDMAKLTVSTLANAVGPHRLTSGDPRLWILMYHRVLPTSDRRYQLEEPGMIVTPDTFAMHLQQAKRHFDIVHLSEWLRLRDSGQPLPKKACAITFDDGWADNYEFAFPIIKQQHTPITLFAVAEKIGSDFQFWPNLVAALLFSNALSAMQTQPVFARAAEGLVAVDTANREYAARYIANLKQFSDSEIFTALTAINWKSLLTFELGDALMTWPQLQEMAASGLVQIGSHTCSHKRLTSTLPAADMEHEIAASKTILESQLHFPVNLFCFPNGDYDQHALRLVKHNYSAAVTTQRGIVNAKKTANHELCRIGLHEHISNTPRSLGARLSGWL